MNAVNVAQVFVSSDSPALTPTSFAILHTIEWYVEAEFYGDLNRTTVTKSNQYSQN
jgi:hypothetical protein